jgi:DNA-binding response OmpR family regulator
MGMKVLIIEDEKELSRGIREYLLGLGYVCDQALDYKSGLEKIDLFEYDVVLLDLMLPGGDGIDLLKRLKVEKRQEGVIILSAKNALEDKLEGLNLGADDYLPKPFHLPELAARLQAIFRRKSFHNQTLVEEGPLSVDMQAREVFIKTIPIELTKREYDLLLFFLSNKNRVISKSAIAEYLTGDMADMLDSHDFVYTHIKNLKRKLKMEGVGDRIVSIYGVGYKWES